MYRFKRAALHGLLATVLAVMPVTAFGFFHGDDENNTHNGEKGKTEHVEKTDPHVEKTAARFNFGVYYGRPYYYRPYYYYYPYRPYYYRYYYYPHRNYRW